MIEEGITRHGTRPVPNRVEHGAVVRPDQVGRLAGLGVACVVQPAFIPTFGEGMRQAIGPGRSAWSHRARSLTAGQAVRASTEGSSQISGQHARKGRLVAGQLADMVFLEEHPADVAVQDIASIRVLATAVGGVFTHRRSRF